MAEGALESQGAKAGPRLAQWLFDPFVYVAGGRSMAIGLAAILLAGFLGSLSNTHFDGVLDLHTGFRAPRWLFLAEGIIDWLSVAAVLFVLGKLASRTEFRARDLFGTQAMARWPTLIAALAALAPPYRRCVQTILAGWDAPLRISAPSTELVVFGLVVLAVILTTVWMVALMYRSYTVCCNIRGVRAAATLIFGVLAAEVVSKLAIVKLAVAASAMG